MKKLLLLLLIVPIIGKSQIGNIFPTEIVEIISIGDGEFYDVPQGYVFQPMIGKESSFNVYSINGSNRNLLFDSYGRGLIGGGYSVKGHSEFFSGVLLDFSSSNFNFIFVVDEIDGSPTTITVPNDKFWYLLQFNTVDFNESSYGFGVIPNQTDVELNSTSSFCCDYNDDGVFDELDNDTNGDGVIDENDKYKTIHFLIAIEMDITSINNSLSFTEHPQFENIHFYPNPTSSLLALNSDKDYDIEVYDMAGNKVMALTGNTIDMSHLSSATYIVKALDKVENEEVSYRVVKN
jgi:hypothetical protein